jgi:hypothetical protein
MMQSVGSLEWWDTPVSRESYKSHFVTEGSWQNDVFMVPIDCAHEGSQDWDRWLCLITNSIWVRVVADEFYDVVLEYKLPDGPFRAPFYRIVGSWHLPLYERFLRETARINPDDSLGEYLIASMEHHVHILAMEEPSFNNTKQPAN